MIKLKLYNCGIKGNSEYSLGLGYLKTNSYANIEIVSDKEKLKDCDLMGLSITTAGIKEAINILDNTKIPVIIGGEGCLWNNLLDYNFKHIVIGEGEIALNKILSNINTKIIKEEPIENLDSLNFPDRGKCGLTVPIISSRGCPFNCSFCSTHKFWDNYRLVSAKYFIEEVEYILKKYPLARTLYIVDDLFIFQRKRFYQIFELWMKKQFNKRLNLRGFVRADTLTFEIAKQMKLMGFKKIEVGFESGSNRILGLLNKKISVENNQQVIDIANKVGLILLGSFMYNIPTETPEDKELTIKFIEKNKGKLVVNARNKFVPLPGTDLYNNENPLLENFNFIGKAQQYYLNKK